MIRLFTSPRYGVRQRRLMFTSASAAIIVVRGWGYAYGESYGKA